MLVYPVAITGMKVGLCTLKSVQTAAQGFPLGVLALDMKSQEGIWDAQELVCRWHFINSFFCLSSLMGRTCTWG